MSHNIEHLGKGAIRDTPDDRDFQAASSPLFAEALQAVDWSQPFSWEEPPNEDQNGSSSCVGQGWSYYHWQLKRRDYSRRYLYAPIHSPGGGAEIRMGGLRIVTVGQATRDEVPDPNPETESAMINMTGITDAQGASDRELDSYVLTKNIDSYAAAIKAFRGVVGGLCGTNQGWADLTNPRPPIDSDTGVIWGHCLYFFGYHMHDGQKCLIAKSSWGTAGNTTVHHIKENYFTSGQMFNPWTLIPKDSMKLINDNGTIYIVGGKNKKIGLADPGLLTALTDIEDVQTGSTSGIPQVHIIKQLPPSPQGFEVVNN
jgi:hypothetical protein